MDLKRLILLFALALTFNLPTFGQRTRSPSHSSRNRSSTRSYYGGGHHTKSHGGHYSGETNAHHKGGHYKNAQASGRYGKHKP
jgi:hypothetical protein